MHQSCKVHKKNKDFLKIIGSVLILVLIKMKIKNKCFLKGKETFN